MAKKVIKGLSKVLSKLKKFGKEADVVIDQTTEGIAMEIMVHARQLAPNDTGGLSGSIYQQKEGKAKYKIATPKEYAAYMEFGTGSKVKIPSEMKAEAAKFRGKSQGSFEEGVKAMEDWLRRNGGDPKDAKWVLIKIIQRGLTAKPFLYPAFVKGRKKYLMDLKQELKRLTKKYD